MKNIQLPYGTGTITAALDEDRIQDIVTTELSRYRATESQEELVRNSLANPVGTPRLSAMARDRDKVVILSSDHTRPVPSRIIMPLILEEIRSGNPQADITILIATGCHRASTREELELKFGEELVCREKIVVHDCDDEDNMIDLGKLPSGGTLRLNRLAVEADLLVAEGFIEPHFFAGYSGGRKSVMPGVAARETVLYNHNSRFIADENSRAGRIQDNPIHCDMLYAARRAGLDFIVNVVINPAHEIIKCVSGDCDLAHTEGRNWLDGLCRVQVKPARIVITTNGGYPLDQNIYQAVKGMTAAEAVVEQGGVIIMAACSGDGHGGEAFYRTFKEERDEDHILGKFMETDPEHTIVDQWQSQIFARVLKWATVIYISDMPDALVEELHMIPAHSLEEAVRTADRILGTEGEKITVIPDGVSVIAERAK